MKNKTSDNRREFVSRASKLCMNKAVVKKFLAVLRKFLAIFASSNTNILQKTVVERPCLKNTLIICSFRFKNVIS